MKLFNLFTPLCFLALTMPLAAQQINGRITDAQTGAAVPFTTVRLFSLADSTLAGGAITDEAGDFVLLAQPGRYYAVANALSYRPFVLPTIEVAAGATTVNLGALALEQSANQLQEVEVRADKSSMQLSLDKKIFNVGKDLANAGGNAADILGNIPAVSVEVDGTVSMRGTSNVKILIDGKPSGLLSFKGADGLRQLQGSLIERVEIITNPSARYEAEGSGGIINIVLRKEKTDGINGAFDLIAGYPTNYGVAANLNFRRKNLNFFINYGLNYRNTPGYGSIYQEVYNGDSTFIYDQQNDHRQIGFNNSINGGLDYYFNDKNILTASYTWRRSNGRRTSRLEYRDYLFSKNNPTGINVRTQDEQEIEPNAEYALNYKRTFAREGHEFTAEVRYLDNWEDSDQDFVESTYNPDFSPNGEPDLLEHSYNFETEKQLLFQADYVHPFGKDGKWETGLRSTLRDMTNDYLVEQLVDGVWQPEAGLNNNFIYNENIHAAYGIYGNKVRKFSYQLGLRLEMTDVTTTLKQTNEVNPRQYANLFPSAHVTYELPHQNAIQVSYSRRTRRPRYWDLSPFFTFTDNRNYFSGNPDLNPEFTDSYELGHVLYLEKGSLSSAVYYRHTTGEIERIRRVDAQGNSVTRPENLATEDAFGAEFTTAYSPYEWWKVDANFNFFRAITDGGNIDETLQSDTYRWFTRLTSRFTLWKNTDVQIRGNYRSRSLTTQGYRKPSWQMDLAISRDILSKKATLTLNATDLFNSNRNRSVSEGDNFYSYNDFQWRARQINLTFSYRLHQDKKREDRKPAEGGGDE